MSNILVNDMFIPTFSFNDEVVNKLDFHWTEKDKRKGKVDFQFKYLLIKFLSSKELCYDFTYDSTKEVWSTLEMIYGVSPSI